MELLAKLNKCAVLNYCAGWKKVNSFDKKFVNFFAFLAKSLTIIGNSVDFWEKIILVRVENHLSIIAQGPNKVV